MFRFAVFVVLSLSGLLAVHAAEPAVAPSEPVMPAQALGTEVTAGKKKIVVYVIPVRDQIATPVLYILRRGLKDADQLAAVVLLDMDTPGGALDVTFEIMEALGKFKGETLTYVNKEAMSAGAFISATTGQIWFAPDAVIGAAAPVSGDGKDIDTTMNLKIVSYLKARVRAISEGKAYRGQVISAMIDADYELKVGDVVIKPKGELLSLTATEANKTYGEPAQALLGSGIAKNIDELLTKKYGAGNYVINRLEITWSETLAQYLTKLAPILMGLGLVALFIEFKTPGFGIFGVSGILLLGTVFLSNYVAGFSGHEPLLIFGAGLVLVALELFLFPGVVVVALSGVLLMLGSLVWAMADLWPGEPVSVAWSADAFVRPLQNLGLGLILSGVFSVLLARFIPSGWVWDKMVVGSAVAGTAQASGGAPNSGETLTGLIGQTGVAVTVLRPSGQVEIAGRRYEAIVETGAVDAGDAIVVCGRSSFALIVKKATS